MSPEDQHSFLAEVIRAKEEEKREAETVKLWQIALGLLLLPFYLAWKIIWLIGTLALSIICGIVQLIGIGIIFSRR